MPELSCLVGPTSGDSATSIETLTKGAESFVALCKLTKILGQVLPLIYVLRRDSLDSTMKLLRRIETLVDEWEATLPPWLSTASATFDRAAPGALNLRLSFLALGQCMCRVALQVSLYVFCCKPT